MLTLILRVILMDSIILLVISILTVQVALRTRLVFFGAIVVGTNILPANISNLGLINANVNVTATSGSVSDVGIAAGYVFNGVITNVYTTGTLTVTGVGTNNNFYIGGLLGFYESSSADVFTTANVYSTASINVSNYAIDVGGLIGRLIGNNQYALPTTLVNSYTNGKVTCGTNCTSIGGLVGAVTAGSGSGSVDISTSYSTSSVNTGTNGSEVGGLVADSSGGTSISQSYSAGSVTTGSGSNDVGGFVANNGSSITQSFWDTATSGQSVGVASGFAATSLTGGCVRRANG